MNQNNDQIFKFHSYFAPKTLNPKQIHDTIHPPKYQTTILFINRRDQSKRRFYHTNKEIKVDNKFSHHKTLGSKRGKQKKESIIPHPVSPTMRVTRFAWIFSTIFWRRAIMGRGGREAGAFWEEKLESTEQVSPSPVAIVAR